jgi:pheromone shutdown protein TraB
MLHHRPIRCMIWGIPRIFDKDSSPKGVVVVCLGHRRGLDFHLVLHREPPTRSMKTVQTTTTNFFFASGLGSVVP